MAQTTASRRGSKNSGVRSSVQSWEFSLISSLNLDENGTPILTLSTAKDSRGSWGDTVYCGLGEDFTKLMKLVREVGTQETIKTLTRKLKNKK